MSPVESYPQLVEKFPGIDHTEPQALGRLAFYAAVHALPDEFMSASSFDEGHEPWHSEVSDVLYAVDSWSEDNIGISRLEMATRIRDRKLTEQKITLLSESLDSLASDQGLDLLLEFLKEGNYRVSTEVAPSPLFPEGRTAYKAVHEYIDPKTKDLHIPYHSAVVDINDEPLDSRLNDYLETEYPMRKSVEEAGIVLGDLEMISTEEFEELRSQYGAKAAGLMCFKKRSDLINKALETTANTITVKIPPFIPVDVAMYEAWLVDPSSIDSAIEKLRKDIIGLTESDYYGDTMGFVVIRSSAVKSEDGDTHTGAGVYESIAVDPSDSVEFQKAVDAVYASTTSQAALTYQNGIGVEEESMGLVVQQYSETQGKRTRDRDSDSFFGHANSVGQNPNLVEVNTNAGELIYDGVALRGQPLITDMYSVGQFLHTHPDHDTPLRSATRRVGDIAHVVVVAEKLFGKPMQVEFVNSTVVQVRPLVIKTQESEVTFPDDLIPVSEVAAVGVGDLELEKLSLRGDNTDKRGFLVFEREYEYTISRNHAGYAAFPEEGAVIIMRPSSSGHIQAICREKGLLCFYPNKNSSLGQIEDVLYGDQEDYSDDASPVKLRFVADGYNGKIYKI